VLATWAPDGERIAYSSDRNGNFDIWMQQIGGGPPVALTDDPAPDWMPDWSPDGTRIVFRSERDGGGLFVVSPSGGAARRLTTFGYRPLWSPDGSRILFYETPPRWAGFAPRLFVVADDGSPPRVVGTALPRPLDTCCWRGYGWHPDGRRISVFWGNPQSGDPTDGPGGWHFWTMGVDDDSVVRSEIAPDVLRVLESSFVGPSAWLSTLAWSPGGDALYLTANDRPTRAIWRMTIDPITLAWVRGPDRLTSGPGNAVAASLSRNGRRIVFSTQRTGWGLYSWPFDPVTAHVTGDAVLLQTSALHGDTPDVSPDGRQLVYDDEQRGLRVRTLATGKETLLFERDDFQRNQPRWSRDGSCLFYLRAYRSANTAAKYALTRLTLANHREELITSLGSDFVVHGNATSDGRWILATMTGPSPGRWRLVLLPTAAAPRAETQPRVLVDDPATRLFPHRLSPDDRWVTLSGGASARGEGSTVFVMRLDGRPPQRIADGPTWEWQDWPQWAPDGRTIYFVSDRSGFFDVWARHFDPQLGPIGPLLKVTDLDNPMRMIAPWAGGTLQAIAVSRDRLVLPIFENSGNLWMIDHADR
jgi:Tol biopolymer transport system component